MSTSSEENNPSSLKHYIIRNLKQQHRQPPPVSLHVDIILIPGIANKPMTTEKYYAVRIGRTPGVYDSWEAARLQVISSVISAHSRSTDIRGPFTSRFLLQSWHMCVSPRGCADLRPGISAEKGQELLNQLHPVRHPLRPLPPPPTARPRPTPLSSLPPRLIPDGQYPQTLRSHMSARQSGQEGGNHTTTMSLQRPAASPSALPHHYQYPQAGLPS